MSQKFEWTEERINIVRRMWREGAYITAIASTVGTSRGVVQRLVDADRKMFPHRYRPHKPISHRIVKPVEAPAAIKRISHADRVVRVTEFGARVTLPRVTFIDGPAA